MVELRKSSRLSGKSAEKLEPAVSGAKVVKAKKPAAATPKKPATSSNSITIGDAFPENISLLDQDGEKVDVSDQVSKGITVIFAYPRASTPGCTRQACGFRDLYPKYKQKDVKVFGLSADSVKAQKTFKSKQNLPYQLLSDPQYQLIGPLGAKKTAAGGLIRSHWIIKDGKFLVVKVGVKPEDSFNGALKSIEEN